MRKAKKEAGIQSSPVYENGILKTWYWRLPKEEKDDRCSSP
jgi:hypothetical protein